MFRHLRFPALFLALLLLTGGLALAETAAPETAGDSTNYACVCDGQAYLLEENTLWEADAALEKTKEIFQFDKPVSGLSVDGSIAFYCVQDGDTAHFASLNIATLEQKELFSCSAERPLFEMLVHDQIVYALWEYTFDELMERSYTCMCAVTAHDLSGNEVSLPFSEATAIVPSSRYGLLVSVENSSPENCFFSYNPDSGILESLSAAGRAINMAVGPDDKVYVRDFDGVYRYDAMEGSPTIVELLSDGNTQTGLICTGDFLISYARQGDWNIQKWPLGEAQDKSSQTLTLVNCYDIRDSQLDYAIRQLKERHPGLEVEFQTLDDDALTTAILAQDSQLDILYTRGYNAQTYIDAGVLYDLSQEATLMEQLQGMVGASAMFSNGICYGVPVELSWNGIVQNESLSEYAPDIDLNSCDWIEFLQAAEQFQPDINGDGQPDLSFLYSEPLYPIWMNAYCALFDDASDIEFDTQTFRTLMESYKRCANAGLIQLDDESTALYQIFGGLSLMPSNICALPGLEGKRIQITETFSLCVMNHSAQHSLAVELLEIYTSDEAASQCYGVRLKADSSLYPAYADYTTEEKQNLERQKGFLQNATLGPHIDASFSVYTSEQLEKYYADQISIDELISNLQGRLSMILNG